MPDFLLYPNTRAAMWFEVKGKFPAPEEVRKAQALANGTGLPAYVYSAELALPALGSLTEMTSYEEFIDHEEERIWLDEYGWARYPQGPAA